MSAKLHKSLSMGKLVVRNRISGEIMLYFAEPGQKPTSICLHPNKNPVDLLKIASIEAWKRGNLAQVVGQRHLDVIL